MVSSIPAVYDARAMPRGRDTYYPEESQPEPGTFGYCVFDRRWNQLGLTQEELAARVRELGGKVKQGDISELEHGKVGEPRRPRMRLFAQALEVPINTLYAWRDDPSHGARIMEDGPAHDPVRRELIDGLDILTNDEVVRLNKVRKRMIEARLAALANKPKAR